MIEKKDQIQNERLKLVLFWGFMFAGAFLVLSRMGYSDGDDAFFYQYANSMGFAEYLGWRYENWVGRVAAEALVYVTFRLGLWFWRTVNAVMLILLPIGLIRLACRAARVPEGKIRNQHRMQPVGTGCGGQYSIPLAAAAVSGYFLMSIMTLGYAAVWVNGSIFYTWSFTCGIWSLMPFAESVFGAGERAECKDRRKQRMFLYSIPCSVIASMSIEQMGAVLLVFELLGFLFCFYRDKKINVLLLVQLCVTVLAFGILFAAPGNDIRVSAEITNWMPQYGTLSFGEHLFITMQWLLSSFANENRLFLCGILAAGMILVLENKERKPVDMILTVFAGIFLASALLPCAGITFLSDLGMNLTDVTVCMKEVPAAEAMTPGNWTAFFWWAAVIIFTFIYLIWTSGFRLTLILAYLAGIASEAIMFFSPTMYASGERVYYLTDLLYLFVMLCLSLGIHNRKLRNFYYVLLITAGMINFVFQFPRLMEYLM